MAEPSQDTLTRPESQPDRSDGWHFADLLALVWRRRLIVGGTVFIISVTALVSAFVMTPQFTARASFMAPPDERGAVSSFLRDPLNAVLGRGGGASLDRLVSFLNSATARRIMVDRFDLVSHYRVKLFTAALLALEARTTVVVTPEGTIEVAVEDRDPQLAADLANGYVDIVDSLYRKAETSHARQLRIFLEARVTENSRALAAAETAARNFAENYGVYALPEQVTVLVDQLASVEALIRTLDVKIGAARQIFGPDHFSLREMTVERAQLVSQRRTLLASSGSNPEDPLFSLKDVPERALQYVRLEREIKIQTLIQQLLVQQHEMAKLDEMRTVSMVTRLDRAVPPEIRSWPRRGRIVILSGIMSVIWGIILAYLAESLPGIRRRIAQANAARTAPAHPGAETKGR